MNKGMNKRIPLFIELNIKFLILILLYLTKVLKDSNVYTRRQYWSRKINTS